MSSLNCLTPPAGHIGITDVLRRTLANGGPAIVLAQRARAAGGAGAGVELTVGVGVARVAGPALAHSRPAANGHVVNRNKMKIRGHSCLNSSCSRLTFLALSRTKLFQV
jgi:hypothetical protein